MDLDQALTTAVTSVTKKWAKQRKAEERHASAESRRRYAMTARAVTIRDVAFDVMEAAYMKASGGGTLPALARQIMYAARPLIQDQTGRQLQSAYFTQTLLPDYMAMHPVETADWDVVFDARGHFEEPHSEHHADGKIALGTLEVRRYLRASNDGGNNLDVPAYRFPTHGPEHRFGGVLFIEKEGFMPLFERVGLAERYDIAIMSTKGVSVTAARSLVDAICQDVPLLVLHDFDKSGFTILGTLQRDTRRYFFTNAVHVVDLGLRLADVQDLGLEEESVYVNGSAVDARRNLRVNGATTEEIEFLVSTGTYRGWSGRRVELNAMASDQLVEFIESKLEEHGIGKVVPDDETLVGAFRDAVENEALRRALAAAKKGARDQGEKAELPDDLAAEVRARLDQDPVLAWDEAIAELAQEAMKDRR